MCSCIYVSLNWGKYRSSDVGIVDVQDFLAEAEVMKNLHHPNLLQLYGICSLEEPMYIILELMKHGSLLEYLRSGDGRHLTLNQMVDIMAQIAAGECVLILKLNSVHAHVEHIKSYYDDHGKVGGNADLTLRQSLAIEYIRSETRRSPVVMYNEH